MPRYYNINGARLFYRKLLYKNVQRDVKLLPARSLFNDVLKKRCISDFICNQYYGDNYWGACLSNKNKKILSWNLVTILIIKACETNDETDFHIDLSISFWRKKKQEKYVATREFGFLTNWLNKFSAPFISFPCFV